MSSTSVPTCRARTPTACGSSKRARPPGATAAVRPPNALPNFDYFETLVGDSGGRVSRMLSMPEVAMAVKNLVDELQYEYLVGYRRRSRWTASTGRLRWK